MLRTCSLSGSPVRAADRDTPAPGRGTVRHRPATGLFALAMVLALSFQSAAAFTKPYIPASDATVLQQVPPESDPAVRRMNAMRHRLSVKPGDMKLAVELARAYIDFGRHRGDARYLGYAEAAIAPWMRQSPPPVPIALLDATLLQSRHHFKAARAELRKILRRAPDNLQAWLTLAVAAMVQGDFTVTRSACAHTLEAPDQLASAGCIAGLAAATGHAQQGYDLLVRILRAEPLAAQRKLEHAGADAIRSWAEGLMADAAKRLGHNAAADRHFKRALQLSPGDNFLLADYADFLLDQGRPQAAYDLVKDDKQSDTSFLRMVFAEAALGSPDAVRDTRIMHERFAAMDLRGSHVYRREQVRFVLHLEHDPARALKLAQENWRVQRAPWDIRVYMAAALAAHRPAAALPALKLYESSGLQDPHIAPLAKALRAQLHQEARR